MTRRLAALLASLTLLLVLTGGCDGDAGRKERADATAKRQAENASRLAKGAEVRSTATISSDETIKVLTIPHEEFGVVWEKTCIVYTHQTFRVAQLWCDNSGGISRGTD